MRSAILLIISLMFSLFFLVSDITAQREMSPSIPVPVKWVMDNTDKIVGIYPQSSDKKSIIKSDKFLEAGTYRPCMLEWKTNKSKDGVLIFVTLGDMNPQSVTVLECDTAGNDGTGFWQVRMFATGKKKAVGWSVPKGVFYSNEIRIVLRDKLMGERFASALRDALTVCGGKPDSPEPY